MLLACGGESGSSPEPQNSSAATASGPAGTSAAAAPKRGGTLVIGIATESFNIDPHFSSGGGDAKFFYLTNDNLVAYNQKGLVDPSLSLAEKWEYPDNTTLSLTLRPGVTVVDSEEAVDSALIAWNLARAVSPKATAAVDLVAVDRVETPTPTNVVLRLKEPNGALLTALGDRAGSVVSRRKAEQLGNERFAREPWGSGMFKLVEWKDGASMKYQKNPKFWRKDSAGGVLPYVDALDIRVIPENAVRIAALESGEIHTTTPTPTADYKRLNANRDLRGTEWVGATSGRFTLNITTPPLDNEWFRLALAWALDRENYKKNFLLGTEPEMHGLLTPTNWAFDPTIPAYGYDPAKVKEYLQRSGLPPEKWRVVSQPHPGPQPSDAEIFWQASAAQFGIKLEFATNGVTNGYATKVLKNLGADGSVPIYMGSWSMRVEPDASLSQHLAQKGAYNAGAVNLPDIEPLLVKARQSLVLEERKALYSRIERLAVEHAYSYIGTGYTIGVDHSSKKVGGLDQLFGGEGKHRWGNLWLQG